MSAKIHYNVYKALGPPTFPPRTPHLALHRPAVLIDLFYIAFLLMNPNFYQK